MASHIGDEDENKINLVSKDAKKEGNIVSSKKKSKLNEESTKAVPMSPGSDYDDNRQNARENRLSKSRFGHTVKFEKYKTNNLIKIICITIGIIIIPLEIFVQNVL